MPPQPHRNEARFYAYPLRRLAAVLDDPAAVEDALSRLRAAVDDVSEVYVLSGPEGADLLDRHGRRHGLRGRLLRVLQWTSSEDGSLDVHDRALRNGGHVVLVPAPDEDDRERVAEALLAAGGHDLVYFGRFVTESGWRRP